MAVYNPQKYTQLAEKHFCGVLDFKVQNGDQVICFLSNGQRHVRIRTVVKDFPLVRGRWYAVENGTLRPAESVKH